jgi:hypothetical protein
MVERQRLGSSGWPARARRQLSHGDPGVADGVDGEVSVAARRRWFGQGSLVRQEEAASLGSLVGRGSSADGERQQWSDILGGARWGNNAAGDGSSVRRRDGFSIKQREKREGQVEEPSRAG